MGSTRVARRTGPYAASSPTASSADAPTTIGTIPPTSRRSTIVAARRLLQNAAGRPRLTPVSRSSNACFSIMRTTSPRVARRHPHADLFRPTRDGVSQQPVEANRSQQRARGTEESPQDRQQPLGHDGGIHLLRQRGHASHRGAEHLGDDPPRVCGDGGRPDIRPHRELGGSSRHCRKDVDRRRRRVADLVILRVAGDADDLVWLAFVLEPYVPANRITAGEIVPRNRLVDDDAARLFEVDAAKIPSGQQRRSVGGEIIRRDPIDCRPALVPRGFVEALGLQEAARRPGRNRRNTARRNRASRQELPAGVARSR